MAINQDQGQSVYLTTEDLTANPPYFVAQKLIPRYSKSKYLLELAGGALYSSGSFSQKGYHLTSLELDDSLINYVHQHFPKVTVIKADLEKPLPPIPHIQKVDFVLALDIFEHFSASRIKSLLRELQKHIGSKNFYCLVSMPTISWKSFNTWFEFFKCLLTLTFPKKGLLDRTHKIYTDTNGHKKIFRQAGYRVVSEFSENALDYLSGDWPDLKLSGLHWNNDPRNRQNKKLYFVNLLSQLLPRSQRPSFLRYHLTSRGIYLLQPK